MNENSQIKQKIIDKITKGQVKMRPRVYFVFKMLFFAAIAALAFFLSLFIISFIIFILKTNGNLFLFRFGGPGLAIFLASFPWLFVLLFILLIALFTMLFKGHKFVYTKPLIYFILGIILIILITGFLFSQTPFHNNLFNRAQKGRLPMMGDVYLKYGRGMAKDFYVARVLDYTNQGFNIKTNNNQEFFVKTNKNTKFAQERDIKKDDTVIVIGKAIGNVINAKAVKIIKTDLLPIPRMLMQK